MCNYPEPSQHARQHLNIPVKDLTGGETSSASNSYEYKHVSLSLKVFGKINILLPSTRKKHMVLKRLSFQNICRESNDKFQPVLPQNMAFNPQNSVFFRYHKKNMYECHDATPFESWTMPTSHETPCTGTNHARWQ